MKLLGIFICVLLFVTALPISAYFDNNGIQGVTTEILSNTGWVRTYGGRGMERCYSVQETTDGGYVIAGVTASYGDAQGDAWLLKTDADGNLIWERVYDGSGGMEFVTAVRETADGGFITAGITESYGSGMRDIWLIKTNASGVMLWNTTFGGSGDDYAHIVQPTLDNGYMLAGGTSSYGAGDYDFWLIKTNASGIEQWNNTYGGTGFDYGEEGWQTADGGYIITGYTYTYGAGENDAWLIKTDVNGSMMWNKTFGGPGEDIGHSVQQTIDGGYIVSGGTESFGTGAFNVWLIKTNATGEELWNHTFGGRITMSLGWCIQETADGGYIISGSTRGFSIGLPIPGVLQQVVLFKTDSDGNIRWQRKLRTRLGIGCKVQQTSDNGYIIAGYTGSYFKARDILLIKTNPEGKPLHNFLLWI